MYCFNFPLEMFLRFEFLKEEYLAMTATEVLDLCKVCAMTMYRRRQWHPTPVLLPGKSHGWRSLVGCTHGVASSRTRMSDFTFTFHFHALEKEMATHSSVLAWRIPGTAAHQAPLSMGFSRQEYWSGVPLPSPFVT